MKNPAIKIISHYGSIREAATAFNVSYESMRRWFEKGIPLECCLRVEKVSNGVVRAEEVLKYWRSKKL